MAQGLAEVKYIIKSLIISSPRAMTIEDLNNDYRKMEGQNIPYAKLGFSSLENFCRSIPDTMTIVGYGLNAKVNAICSEKLEHINKMVSKQKNASVTRKRMVEQPPPPPLIKTKQYNITSKESKPDYSINPSPQTKGTVCPLNSNTPQFRKTYDNNNQKFYSSNNFQWSFQPYSAPPLTYQQGINYYQYNQPYNQLFGNQQQFYGNLSLGNMYGTQQNYFYNPLMAVDANFRNYSKNNKNIHHPQMPQFKQHQQQQHQSIPPTSLPTEHLQQSPFESKLEKSQEIKINDENKSNQVQINEANNLESQKNPIKENSKENIEHSTRSAFSEFLEKFEKTESDSKKIKNTNPFLSDDETNDTYSTTTKSNMICDHQINVTAEDELSELSNRFSKIEISKNKNKTAKVEYNRLSESSTSSSDHVPVKTNGDSNLSSSNTENRSLKNNKIKILIKTTKEELEELDRKKHNKIKKKTKTENSSISNDKFSALKDDDSSRTQDQYKERHKSDALPKIISNSSIIMLLDYPSDTATFKDTIPYLEITPEISEAKHFPLFIAEVHNPYKFWFHVLDPGNDEEPSKLDTLMQNLENVYSDFGSETLKMHAVNIRPGQLCCTTYGDTKLWHRAEILAEPIDDNVKVLFIDYGTVSIVPIQNVKYLLKDFCKLPRQIYRGCLSHIKPIGRRWTRDATLCFLSMISEIMLYAKATEIDYKENVVRMVIIDTNHEKEFQINEALIIKGHAIYCDENINSSHTERKIHFQETYPSFEKLEKGQYPSFTEIGEYLSQGIDFEKMQDETILDEIGNENIIDYNSKLLDFECDDESNEDKNEEENKIILNSNKNNYYESMPSSLNCPYNKEEKSNYIMSNMIYANNTINEDYTQNLSQNKLEIENNSNCYNNLPQYDIRYFSNPSIITGTTLMNSLNQSSITTAYATQKCLPPPGFENVQPKFQRY